MFRRFCDAVLEQCQQARLIWGKELSSDATKVDANASVASLVTRFAVEARQALQNHLEELFGEETDPPLLAVRSPSSPNGSRLDTLPTCLA